jgi:MFS family permease
LSLLVSPSLWSEHRSWCVVNFAAAISLDEDSQTQTYIFYQLQAIDASKSANEIIREAAILQTVFTLMQGITALLWGYVADSPRGGRKIVLLIGLSGSRKSNPVVLLGPIVEVIEAYSESDIKL